MSLQFLSLGWASVLVVIIGILFSSSGALAAEQVVLKYRIFHEAISVEELSTFAETGELSTALRLNFALARQDPKAVRRFLTQPVRVNPIFLGRVLNSPVGNIIVDQVSQVVHTPSNLADQQAGGLTTTAITLRTFSCTTKLQAIMRYG